MNNSPPSGHALNYYPASTTALNAMTKTDKNIIIWIIFLLEATSILTARPSVPYRRQHAKHLSLNCWWTYIHKLYLYNFIMINLIVFLSHAYLEGDFPRQRFEGSSIHESFNTLVANFWSL